MKRKIVEFNPVIYPFRLWVGIAPEFKDVDKKFYALNSDMEKIDVIEKQFETNRFTIARTYLVTNKKDGWIGPFVCVYKPELVSVKTIAHEAAHCADFICEEFGITRGGFDNGEAYAYLIGWISECIKTVVKSEE